MQNYDDAQIKVLEATISVFNEKGLRFTMDDIARAVSMSKKTLYVLFRDKEALMEEMVDYCFTSIKEAEAEVLENESLDTVEKISRILGVMPKRLQSVDLRKLHELKGRYPAVYRKVTEHLAGDWEPTIALLQQGEAEGKLRHFSVPVFQTILEATIASFFSSDILEQSGLTYTQGLEELTQIMVRGILT